MAKQEFKVAKSSEYTMKDGTIKFASKLVSKSVDDLLGLESQITLFLHGKKALPIGESIMIDVDDYVIEDRPYVLPEGADNAGETIQLKTIVRKCA